MTRLFIYLLLVGSVLYFFSWWSKKQGLGAEDQQTNTPKSKNWFRPKLNPREIWMQVYETANLEEARLLQARIQEEDIECVVYEQGKKDIHGNLMTAIGIVVPKSTAPHAQKIVSRMPS